MASKVAVFVLALQLLSSTLALPESGWAEGILDQEREIPTMTVVKSASASVKYSCRGLPMREKEPLLQINPK